MLFTVVQQVQLQYSQYSDMYKLINVIVIFGSKRLTVKKICTIYYNDPKASVDLPLMKVR
jgi:hypothetical protein